MTRTVKGLFVAAAFSLAPGVHAQQPRSVEQAGGVPATGTLTLTGCLDRSNDGTYELRNARMSSTSGPAAGSTGAENATGTSGTSNDPPTTWILKSKADLASHVGHSVQVTGQRSAPAGTSGSDTATTSEPTTTATGARMKRPGDAARSVDVQTVRMISRICS